MNRPMKFKTLKDHVYDFISEGINTGMLSANEKISESMISETLNISRTPVREALIQLAAEGIIENTPRKGFMIHPVDQKRARELYEIIGPLDGAIAYAVCDGLNEADYDKMKYLIESMYMAIEKAFFDKYYDMQMDFHEVYTVKCENELLVEYLYRFKKMFIKKQYNLSENESMFEILKKTNEQHEVMLGLFIKKEKEALRDFIRDNHWNVDIARFDIW